VGNAKNASDVNGGEFSLPFYFAISLLKSGEGVTVIFKLVLLAGAVSGLGRAVPAQVDDWNRLMEKGSMLVRAGDYPNAIAVYREAVKIAETPSSSNRRPVAALEALAETYENSGQLAQAQLHYRMALRTAEHVDGRHSADYAVLMSSLAGIYLEEGKAAKQETMLREAVGILSQAVSAGS
jgi:tetratricopeptide (TPR) repeat protein